jgi:chromosome partitioning protein
MILTVTHFKGGVGKTTTAINLAAYLQQFAPTLLIDGDLNRSASKWSKRGVLPFNVVDESEAASLVKDYKHIVIDTQARPKAEDLRTLAKGCDRLILPTTPDILAIDALMLMVESLKSISVNHYRILLTMIPPKPSRDAEEALALFLEEGLPVIKSSVRRLVAFQKAALAGLIVNKVKDPRSIEAWTDYQDVAKELLS